MILLFKTVRQSLWNITRLSTDVFFGGQTDGLRRSLILLFTCSLSSLLISSVFLLYLHFGLECNLGAAAGIAAGIGTLLTVAFYLSKQTRCLGTLFLISVFMKRSRTLLLTAGTSLVALRNIHNTLENLRGLLESMICNVNAKKEALLEPFEKYVDILKSIKKTLLEIPDLNIVKMSTKLTVESRLEPGPLKEVLTEAKLTLNGTVKYALTVVNTISSVTEKLFPAISLAVLAALIVLHIKRFHEDLKYKNKFISRKFVEFDEKQKAEGKSHVLPLTPEEEKVYTALPSVRPSCREGRAMLKFGIPVVTHLVAWSIIITVDALLYCFIDVVTTKFSELEPVHFPLQMDMRVIKNLVSINWAENSQTDFSYSVTLFEKKCLPKPKLLLYDSILPLAAILLTLLVMALMASKVAQIRLLLCEHFFSTVTEARVRYLHAKILRKRSQRSMRGLTSLCLEVCTNALVKANVEDRLFTFILLFQRHFWFPLLFGAKEDPQNAVGGVAISG